jgi:hypothetical protein
MKHTADTVRHVILTCHSIRDARNLSHVCCDCCYGATGASLTAREAPCTYECHMRVHSKHKAPPAMIIMKGPRATTRHRLPIPVSPEPPQRYRLPISLQLCPAKLERASNALFSAPVRPRPKLNRNKCTHLATLNVLKSVNESQQSQSEGPKANACPRLGSYQTLRWFH